MTLILIVDDESAQRTLYKHLVDAIGHEVALASNAQSGLDLAISLLPDLIMSDINMPGMDGAGLVRIIKENDLTKNIPVIAVTGMVKSRSYFTERGFDDYLLKPVSVVHLMRVVNEHILKSQAKRDNRDN